jgi:hypothetical protein
MTASVPAGFTDCPRRPRRSVVTVGRSARLSIAHCAHQAEEFSRLTRIDRSPLLSTGRGDLSADRAPAVVHRAFPRFLPSLSTTFRPGYPGRCGRMSPGAVGQIAVFHPPPKCAQWPSSRGRRRAGTWDSR